MWTVELKLPARASTWGLEAGDAPGDQGTGSPSPGGGPSEITGMESGQPARDLRGAARKVSDRETGPDVSPSSDSTSPRYSLSWNVVILETLVLLVGPQASNVTSRLSASSLSFLIIRRLPQGGGSEC